MKVFTEKKKQESNISFGPDNKQNSQSQNGPLNCSITTKFITHGNII